MCWQSVHDRDLSRDQLKLLWWLMRLEPLKDLTFHNGQTATRDTGLVYIEKIRLAIRTQRLWC